MPGRPHSTLEPRSDLGQTLWQSRPVEEPRCVHAGPLAQTVARRRWLTGEVDVVPPAGGVVRGAAEIGDIDEQIEVGACGGCVRAVLNRTGTQPPRSMPRRSFVTSRSSGADRATSHRGRPPTRWRWCRRPVRRRQASTSRGRTPPPVGLGSTKRSPLTAAIASVHGARSVARPYPLHAPCPERGVSSPTGLANHAPPPRAEAGRRSGRRMTSRTVRATARRAKPPPARTAVPTGAFLANTSGRLRSV